MEEKVLHILSIISEEPSLSQRDLADRSGMSLGIVNLIMKRLLKTGHIKISNLNKKKVHYLLTSKGIVQKSRRTYDYVSKTVNTYKEYCGRLTSLISELNSQGYRTFALRGTGDIAQLIEVVLKGFPNSSFRNIGEHESARPQEFVLDCRYKGKLVSTPGVCILAEYLSKEKSAA